MLTTLPASALSQILTALPTAALNGLPGSVLSQLPAL
jgi:hypothetical protein